MQHNIKLESADQNLDLVRKAVCSGYFINAAKIKGIGDYVNLRTGTFFVINSLTSRSSLQTPSKFCFILSWSCSRLRRLSRVDHDLERIHALCDNC